MSGAPNRYSAPKVPSSAVHRQKRHQRVRDGPQHRAERDQLHQRPQEDEQEVRGAAGEGVDVFADALVGVVDVPAVADVVVLALAQVAIQKTVREPAAPVVGERIAHVVVEGVHRNRHCHHHQAGAHRAPEAVHLLGGQGRCEFAGLVDQHHGELGLQHHQANQQGQQPPGHAFLVAQPVGASHAHELLPGRPGERGRASATGFWGGLRRGYRGSRRVGQGCRRSGVWHITVEK